MTMTDAKRLLRILGDLDRFLIEILDPVLKRVGMGREHWQVLRLLEDGEGHAMGEISQAAGLPSATATRIVDMLVANTLVYRRNDPLDRRRVLVHLSETGEGVLHRIEEAFHDHTASLLPSLNGNGEGKLDELPVLVQAEIRHLIGSEEDDDSPDGQKGTFT